MREQKNFIQRFLPYIYSAIFFGLFEGMYWQGGKALLEYVHLKLYGTCIDFTCSAGTTLKEITGGHILMSSIFILGAIICFAFFGYFLKIGEKNIS